MADPYAGIGAAPPDPYAGLGIPVTSAPQHDPYSGLGVPPPPPGFTVQGANTAVQPHSLVDDFVDFSNGVGSTVNSLINSGVGVYKQTLANGPIMNGAVLPGPGGQQLQFLGVRQVMEGAGVGMDKLRAAYPGHTDAEYQQALHHVYNQSVLDLRQEGADQANASQIQDNPVGRAIQMGTNFGANVLANPQYMLVPGGAIGKTALGRVAAAGGVNAAIGSVSDAAAQLSDMAEGIKKNFDVQQNLQSTITSGLFGGAVHGAVEVAPFIKGLFAQRGVDTTPPANPQGSLISPMTTDHIAMNATDHLQYQQLLLHGDVDDIKGFFKGRNGPQPSWSSVNRFVEQRDNPDFQGQPAPVANPRAAGGGEFNYNDQYNAQAEQQWREQNRQAVEDHVNAQMAGWKNAPNVEVVHGPEDITDPVIRAQAMAANRPGGEAPNAPGFFGQDGITRMYSGRVQSPEAANALLYHEGLGHFGLAQQFGDKLDSVLTSLLSRNVNQFSRDTDAWMESHPGAYGGDRLRAAEEVLAERSESGPLPGSWQDALTSTVKGFGRRMGLNLAYSDAEVNHVLAMSHDAVINGKPSASANGFRGINDIQQAPDTHGETNITINGQTTTNKFMRAKVAPTDVASEAYDRLDDTYEPSSRSWDESIKMAQDTALNPDKLKSVRSADDLDKRLFQYDQVAKNLNDKLIGYANKASDGQELTGEEQADAIQTVANFHYALGRIEQDSGQVGRALNAMKAIQFSRNNLLNLRQALADADSPLEGLTDPDTLNKFMAQYKRLGNSPKGQQQLARDLSTPGWEKYALTLYRNMLLSGLGTHVKAPMDMATGVALDMEDRLGAAAVGVVHNALHTVGLAPKGGADIREAIGYYLGAQRALISGEAWSKAGQTFMDPNAQTARMTTEKPAVIGAGSSNPILKGIGAVTTFPTHLIAAQDAFFRNIAATAHAYGMGVAKSLADGGEGLTWSDHITRGITNAIGDPVIGKKAADLANNTLLLNENPITKPIERLKKIGADASGWDRAITAAVDLFTPIVRVPANSLLSRTIARSPLGLFDPETNAMWKEGGAQRDIAISRMAMGTLKLALYWAAAGAGGKLIGDQLKGDKYKDAEATGWRPNSVHENGSYETGNQLAASINPLDTHNSTATMVANMREAYDKGANGGQVATGLMLASSANGALVWGINCGWVTWLNLVVCSVTVLLMSEHPHVLLERQ